MQGSNSHNFRQIIQVNCLFPLNDQFYDNIETQARGSVTFLRNFCTSKRVGKVGYLRQARLGCPPSQQPRGEYMSHSLSCASSSRPPLNGTAIVPPRPLMSPPKCQRTISFDPRLKPEMVFRPQLLDWRGSGRIGRRIVGVRTSVSDASPSTNPRSSVFTFFFCPEVTSGSDWAAGIPS